VKINVAICTWNRASLLEQTLEQMTRLRIPAGVEWELLVVNNNSTDQTAEALERFPERLPLRILFEPKQGHTNARNCALKAACGDLLIWTDDDVLVDENWLAAYADAARRWPEAGYFAGKIVPRFVEPPPKFFRDHAEILKEIVVACDFGPDERPLEVREFPYGANMAFRRSVLGDLRFNPNLGRVGFGMVGCDESDLCRELRARGVVGVWTPSALVQHYVEPQRLTLAFAWRFHEGWGQTLVRLNGRGEGKLFMGAPRWLYRRYWHLRTKSFCEWMLHKPSWFKTYTEAAQWHGQILEHRAIRSDESTG
jgi:glycosyltransferase involved in cell wall biosynthesis